jgi:hypothetical protein
MKKCAWIVVRMSIDLVLIDHQSVEKSLSDGHISMPKRDGRPFTGVSTIFDIEPHSDPPC